MAANVPWSTCHHPHDNEGFASCWSSAVPLSIDRVFTRTPTFQVQLPPTLTWSFPSNNSDKSSMNDDSMIHDLHVNFQKSSAASLPSSSSSFHLAGGELSRNNGRDLVWPITKQIGLCDRRTRRGIGEGSPGTTRVMKACLFVSHGKTGCCPVDKLVGQFVDSSTPLSRWVNLIHR